jgi:hypothetical protein
MSGQASRCLSQLVRKAVSAFPRGDRNESHRSTRFPDQPRLRKSQIAHSTDLVQRTMGGHQMRRELRPETLTYSFHFQISSKGGRQAFSVEVHAPNVQDATTLFRQNWSKIESIARDHLADGIGVRRTLKLAALGDPMRATMRGRVADERRPKRNNSLKRASLRASPCAIGVTTEGQGPLSEPCRVQSSA